VVQRGTAALTERGAAAGHLSLQYARLLLLLLPSR